LARKSFLDGGIGEKKISATLAAAPRLKGLAFPSYRYRKFSYVVWLVQTRYEWNAVSPPTNHAVTKV